MATALIKANKLREADFPRLMEIQSVSAANYFIARTTKPLMHKEHMHVGKVEDLFDGMPAFLGILCEKLLIREEVM